MRNQSGIFLAHLALDYQVDQRISCYLPTGKCMAHTTQNYCNRVRGCLNDRPRKRLGYRTPSELHREAQAMSRLLRQFKRCDT